MRLADLEPAYQGFVRDLLRRSGFDSAAMNLETASDDEMFQGVLAGYPGRPGAAYFRYLESALRTLAVHGQLADHLGGYGALDRVLDFGSGYGRLTRLLRHRLPHERIWVCDIYHQAIAWQARAFGVNGVVSVTDPDRFALPLDFSIVFVGSVFSHLPDGLFQRWLARLHALVGRKGLLAFSTHDVSYAPPDQAIEAKGIGFAAHSESRSLDPGIYGMSYVTDGYVARAIGEACGPAARFRAFPRALFENQDLYVVAGAEVDISSLKVTALPLAGFSRPEGNGTSWRGWGIEPNLGGRFVRADLFVDEVHVVTTTPQAGDQEVVKYFPGMLNPPVGWSFEPRAVEGAAMLRVELTTERGTAASCYASPAVGTAAAPRV